MFGLFWANLSGIWIPLGLSPSLSDAAQSYYCNTLLNLIIDFIMIHRNGLIESKTKLKPEMPRMNKHSFGIRLKASSLWDWLPETGWNWRLAAKRFFSHIFAVKPCMSKTFFYYSLKNIISKSDNGRSTSSGIVTAFSRQSFTMKQGIYLRKKNVNRRYKGSARL